VLTPSTSSTCCYYKILTQVPDGSWALYQEFGARAAAPNSCRPARAEGPPRYKGPAKPGALWCRPVWKGVSHFVTKQTVVFNARPKSCPTKDTVFVDVDLSVNFRLGPDIDNVKKFVFEMGAERLDAYDQVNDLRSEFSSSMLTTLQAAAPSRAGTKRLGTS